MTVSAVVAGLLLGVLLATPFVRSLIKGGYICLVLVMSAAGWRLPSLILPPVLRIEETLRAGRRILKPDFFISSRPLHRQLPAVIVYCPLAPDGKQSPAVKNLLEGLVRVGFAVLAPYWPARPDGMIDPRDINELRASIQYLEARPDVDSKRIGILAVSYGAGPALQVAADQQFGDRLQYVATIGGYADLWSVLRYSASGRVALADQEIQLDPHPFLKYVALRALVRWAPERADRRTIGRFLARLDRDTSIEYDELLPLLTSSGQELLSVLGRDAESVEEFRERFPARLQRVIDQFSVVRSVKKIRSQLLVLHSTNDNIVPVSELHQLMPEFGSKARVSLVRGFNHALPPRPTPRTILGVYLPNLLTMVRFSSDVVRTQYQR